jgi:hypothetical protein
MLRYYAARFKPKAAERSANMGLEAECPICNAYIPVDPDVKPGDFMYCSFCMARLVVTREMLEDDDDDKPKKIDVEEEWE